MLHVLLNLFASFNFYLTDCDFIYKYHIKRTVKQVSFALLLIHRWMVDFKLNDHLQM